MADLPRSRQGHRGEAAKQAEMHTFGLLSRHAFVDSSAEPIFNLPNLVRQSGAVTSPRVEGTEIVERQSFTVIIHLIGFDDSPLHNLPSTKVAQIPDVRVCCKEAYILGRSPRTAEVLDALSVLCHWFRNVFVEFDIVRIRLPCDGLEVVANIKRERCGAAKDARMIDLENYVVLAVLV
jgi:hypothetical protein